MPFKIPSIEPDLEIVSTRIFDYSQALVFEAWRNPEHLQNWWGPAGFTNTFHEFNFREGGKWRFTMHGPDKGHYQNEAEFLNIEAPSLIYWKRHSQPLFRVLVTFTEIAENKTKLVFRMIFDSEADCNKIKRFAIDKNEENFDRLEVELEKMSL